MNNVTQFCNMKTKENSLIGISKWLAILHVAPITSDYRIFLTFPNKLSIEISLLEIIL